MNRYLELCAIPDCGRPRVAHGLCAAHNARRAEGQDLYSGIKPMRRYTATEVANAIELAKTAGISAASRKLAIPKATIGHWAKKLADMTTEKAIAIACRIGREVLEQYAARHTLGSAYEALRRLREDAEREVPAIVAALEGQGAAAIRTELRRRYRRVGEELAKAACSEGTS